MLKVDRSSDYLAWLIYPKPSLLGFCSEFSQKSKGLNQTFYFRIFRVVLLFSYQVSLTSYQVFAVRSLVRQRDIYYHSMNNLSTTF